MMTFLYQKKLLPYLSISLIWIMIGFGVFLRAYHADMFPIDNNDDGLYYVWAGSSFIENPLKVRSHTIFDSSNRALFWRSQYQDYVPHLRFGMKIVQPWFDHPPFGTLLIGLPAYSLGFRQIDQIPHLVVRFPAIMASIFTLFLSFLFAKKITRMKTALFTLLFMVTVPYFVFAHRQAYLENFLTPIFLASTVSYLYYQEKRSKKLLLLSATFAFLCGWIKIPAFGVPIMFLGWSIYKKDFLAAKVFLLTTILSVSSYISYGLMADKQFFIDTLSNQGVRGMYLSSFIYSFVKPLFYGEFMDGQYILGLLMCFSFLLKKEKTEKETFFAWMFMCWVFILFLVSGKLNNSPWYRYPLLPFMSIGLGTMTTQLWEKRSLFIATVFIVFGLSSFDLAGMNFSTTMLRFLILIIFLPFVLYFFFPKIKFLQIGSKLAVIGLLTFIMIGNLLAVYKYPFLRCQQEDCLLPNKIILEP